MDSLTTLLFGIPSITPNNPPLFAIDQATGNIVTPYPRAKNVDI